MNESSLTQSQSKLEESNLLASKTTAAMQMALRSARGRIGAQVNTNKSIHFDSTQLSHNFIANC